MPEISKCLEESPRGSKVVKTLKKMNNKTNNGKLNKSRTLLSSSADNIPLAPHNYTHYTQTRSSIIVNDDLW